MSRPSAALLAGALIATLAGCTLWPGGRDEPDEPREEPGPTLASAPPPADWQDVRSATGLVYSVPPDWEVGDPFGVGEDGRDPGTDWGSGYVTTANAIADRDYCAIGGLSFRTLVGISATTLPGEAREQAESASRAMADSIDRRFTEAGADVPVPEAHSIGVSGVPAWYVSLRGQVRPPRNTCTPPVIRFDTIAVSTRTPDGAPASTVFVLMSDEGEPGVQPTETIDAVVASLRYDNSV
ncbi:hypothetical protein [Dietzia lutea]|uniref:DUF8017 domain-containing protein n=1 Tax=Dietzia lutea TaxID=546160 RepID=A0A2S1R9S6_9ACTN|nr:hypothetical protein [Dietzia lutea]AWH93033.1 hypothetical protein A6035_13580 [Dietzia lutea]